MEGDTITEGEVGERVCILSAGWKMLMKKGTSSWRIMLAEIPKEDSKCNSGILIRS